MPNLYFYIESHGLFSRHPLILYIEIMTNVALTAEIRAKDEKIQALRKDKLVPCVVYGKTQEPISIKIDNSTLLRAYRAAGESTIINLSVGKKQLEVLVHEVQKNPVTGDFLHIDFYAITRGEKVHTHIPLNFIGTSEAVKQGAILDEVLKEVEVKCLPRDLVDHFDVDISVLKEIGDSIRISDLNLDTQKYEIHLSGDTVVATTSKSRAVIEETTTEESSTEA